MQNAMQSPHAAQWLYLSLLAARAPVGTHLAVNMPLHESVGGIEGVHYALETLGTMAVLAGYTGGVS